MSIIIILETICPARHFKMEVHCSFREAMDNLFSKEKQM
jgi:hypothetical protein